MKENSTNVPFYKNGCNHDENEFVCSFKAFNPAKKTWEDFDLYCLKRIEGDNICIRYGEDSSAYLSCGRLIDFLYNAIRHDDYIYREALYQLKKHGCFSWSRK